MAVIKSNMMSLGTVAPDFDLPDVIHGENKTLDDVRLEHGLVVMFICAHCPFVKIIEEEIAIVARRYFDLKIGFVAISSNDADAYPEDSPYALRAQAEHCDFSFPYLYDESQEVARAYNAVCTPDFFVFNEDINCIYHGRFNASTPGHPEPVSEDDLIEALEAHLENKLIIEDQKPSIGCSIKWKH